MPSRRLCYVVRSCLSALLFARVAGAQAMIPFAGFSMGCFGAPCPTPTSATFQTSMVAGLTYENAAFGGVAPAGIAALVGPANAMGVRDVNNLGAFYLSGAVAEYDGQSFFLSVFLTTPEAGGITVLAPVRGFVRLGSEVSGVTIDFDESAQPISFAGNAATLTIADVRLDAPLSGVIAAPVRAQLRLPLTTVPEPVRLAQIAIGLWGLAGYATLARRREKHRPRR